MSDPLASVTTTGYPPDRIQAMENELASLKSQFEVIFSNIFSVSEC